MTLTFNLLQPTSISRISLCVDGPKGDKPHTEICKPILFFIIKPLSHPVAALLKSAA